MGLADLYRATLLDDVVPFWMRHGIDRDFGGIGNVIDDEGRPANHDKYLWSQGRALWTFSALYNRIDPRPEWRAVADHVYGYLAARGRDGRGHWMYRLAADGEVLDRDISIYVDGFVMAGLGEYVVATGDAAAADIARDTYERVLERLRRPGSYGVAPFAIPPGQKTHGIAMIFSFFFFTLGRALDDPGMREQGLRLAYEVLDDFYVADKDAILEFVSLDGEFIDSPTGRACVPGHALEALWFLVEIFEETGDAERIAACCRLIRRHLELGWDDEHGGLRLALDIDGKEPCGWDKADCRPWWVQVEALVATAFAHVHTGEPWALEWHRRVQQYAFARYPQPGGEWTQWLDARGRKIASGALPVKDPFHLPRGLIYLVNLFENRISQA